MFICIGYIIKKNELSSKLICIKKIKNKKFKKWLFYYTIFVIIYWIGVSGK